MSVKSLRSVWLAWNTPQGARVGPFTGKYAHGGLRNLPEFCGCSSAGCGKVAARDQSWLRGASPSVALATVVGVASLLSQMVSQMQELNCHLELQKVAF